MAVDWVVGLLRLGTVFLLLCIKWKQALLYRNSIDSIDVSLLDRIYESLHYIDTTEAFLGCV